MRNRAGLILVAVLATIAFIAVLSIGTLTLSGRIRQGSSLLLSDALLDAAASSALLAALDGWHASGMNDLTVGGTRTLAAGAGSITQVTRLSPELFWLIAAAHRADGTARRENLVVRLRPPAVSDTPYVVSTDSAVVRVGGIRIDSLTTAAGTPILPGASIPTPTGIVHGLGDLTLTGGSGRGILSVDGVLTLGLGVRFSGLILCRGLRIAGSGSVIEGSLRVYNTTGVVLLGDSIHFVRSADVIQAVIMKQLTPKPVSGRRWAEVF